MSPNPINKLGDYFSSSREKGCEGLPLMSVTLNDGLVLRESLDRKTDTNLDPNEHLIVKPGYIAYNMMRVWQGALGRADANGLVSPAYVVLKPNKKVDSLYAEYLFKTARMIYLFWAFSYGLTRDRLRLYYNDFARLPVSLPPLPEQKKIVQILSTWDKAITTTEKLLANSQQQKKALMQQLLTGKKRLLDENGVRFSGEWQKVELGDLLEYEQPTKYLVKDTEYNENYRTPVLTAGKTFVLGKTNEDFGIYVKDLPVIIFDDFTTASKYVDFSFKAKSSAMKILKAKSENISVRFVYEAMQRIRFEIGGHQRHWISIFSNIPIKVPLQASEIKAVSATLACSDKEISELEKSLTLLKRQKKSLMQQLLTGKRRVKVDEVAA